MSISAPPTGEDRIHQSAPSRGMLMFLLMWVSQLISAVGSNLTGFALGVWVYQQSGSITEFALISFFVMLPGILLSPLAGTLVDRWDLRRTMILGDACNGLATLAIALLLFTNQLAVWHIYVTTTIASICLSFQWTAYNTAVSVMVPPGQLGRANGISQIVIGASTVIAPALAGVLFGLIQLQGIVMIDLATFGMAFLVMWLFVRIPTRPKSEQGTEKSSLFQEARAGWSYIWSRPGLIGLLALLAFINIRSAFVEVLITPLVLSFTSPAILGTILSTGGIGMLAGSLLMSIWGGPRRRMYGIFAFVLVQGLVLLLGGLQPNPPLIAGAIFVFLFSEPIIAACNLAIWQSKVAPELQGRVLSLRRMLTFVFVPLAYLGVGPLANNVFEPLLAADGPLAGTTIGRIVGVGVGRGIGLMFVLLGLGTVLLVIVGVRYRPLRQVEQDLLDVHTEESAGALPAAVLTNPPQLNQVVDSER